jgi:hypothetical protein
MPSLLPTTTTNMTINFQEISHATAGKLRWVADWVVSRRAAQQSKSITQRNNEKTIGDKIRLQCFECKFLQEVSKNCCKEPIKQMDWMTKWIKKGNKTHIVAFCPTCTSGDPWIINSQIGYTLLQINPTNKQEPLSH